MCDNVRLIKAIDAFLAKKDVDLTGNLRGARYARPTETVRAISSLDNEIADILEEEKEQIVSSLRQSGGAKQYRNGQWQEDKQKDKAGSRLATLFGLAFSSNLRTYSNDYIRQSSPDMSVERLTERTQAWVDRWSGHLGDIMQDTTISEVDRILAAGIRDNKDIPDVIQDLLDSGAIDSYYRARMTAVTEVLRCHSYAQQEAFMQNPLIVAKEWRHTGGHKNEPRPHHVDMNGQTVPKAEDFTISGPNGTFPAVVPRDASLPASESINCHCIMVAITDESVLDIPYEQRRDMQQEAIINDDMLFAAGS